MIQQFKGVFQSNCSVHYFKIYSNKPAEPSKCNTFKDKLSCCEDELEVARVRLIENGDWRKRAEASEKLLAERFNSTADIQAENRQVAQQVLFFFPFFHRDSFMNQRERPYQ